MIIYKATNKVNGKIYIGLTTKALDCRKGKHFRDVKNGSQLYFHRAIRKYGKDAFEWSIIDIGKSYEELCEKEKYWISHYDSYENGYNRTLGGDGVFGLRHTEEWKKRHSESMTGERHPMYGKKHSDDAKRKISIKKKGVAVHTDESKRRISKAFIGENHPFWGKKFSEEHRKKLSESHTGKTLSEEHKKTIGKSISGENNGMYGRKRSKEEKERQSNLLKGRYVGGDNPNARAIVQLDKKTGEFIAEYPTAQDGANAIGMDNGRANITTCCRGRQPSAYGYKWMYKDEYYGDVS